MSNGNSTFKKITNNDIYDEIQDIKSSVDKFERSMNFWKRLCVTLGALDGVQFALIMFLLNKP